MDRNDQKIISQIRKNVNAKIWKCNKRSCTNPAINSHLLQRNGILNKIAENGHVMELKSIDPFKWGSESVPLEFKKVGIGSALSLSLFCNDCDSQIFKRIETGQLDLFDYQSLLLFCYRIVCAEQRKKEQAVEVQQRILKAVSLKGKFGPEYLSLLKGNELGIKDLEKFKSIIEAEIMIPRQIFQFETYTYPLLKVYGSAVFSTYDVGDVEEVERTNFDDVFIHVIPSDKHLHIICGYLKQFCTKWIADYVESWRGLTDEQLTKGLTNLFSSRIENWGMAPSIHQNISRRTINKMIDFWGKNVMNMSKNLQADFNLFR